ncbi:MAG: hypothetical protein L3J28_12020 [Candidatus Polarisedimenticolaceae bacterium]|nr:hypothetical protein [Candidatus Polarisedimenticolaceae bacterium]
MYGTMHPRKSLFRIRSTADTVRAAIYLLILILFANPLQAQVDAVLESSSITSRPSAAVPEFASFALMGLGLLGLGFARKLRRFKSR